MIHLSALRCTHDTLGLEGWREGVTGSRWGLSALRDHIWYLSLTLCNVDVCAVTSYKIRAVDIYPANKGGDGRIRQGDAIGQKTQNLIETRM